MLERVLFAGGGTGGHVYMAVAIREELNRRRPQTECLFVGTEKGLESRILPPLGFPLRTISASGIKGMGWTRALKGVLRVPGSLLQSRRILKEFRPSAAVGLGGYSSGAVVAASRLAGVPSVVVEPNAVPGFTNRALARWIDGAACAFSETASYFPKKGRLTGIPIRGEFHRIETAVSTAGPLRLLVFGGSRGSRPLNSLLGEALRLLDVSRLRVCHQTGPDDLERVRAFYRNQAIEGEILEYIDDMPRRFAQCDLIVSRAGASTIAEITAAGRPAILVPFPWAADDHQRKNAQALAAKGAAAVVEEGESSGSRLAQLIGQLVEDRGRLAEMAAAARRLAQPRAAEAIVDLLEEVTERR